MNKNSRIAANTIVLYVRMVIVLFVSLYTSRVVLKSLGVDDYGLYNVVGGVVGLFVFFRSSMEKCTQRFLNYEMVQENNHLRDTFSASLSVHLLLVFFILLLSETIGLWFLNNKVQIPLGREIAANWVFQASVLSLCFTVLSVPFSADIIAHERMGFFAIVSILDAILKLAIAIAVYYSNYDHLIMYGALLALISVIDFLLFVIYSTVCFKESNLHLLFDKRLFGELFSYTGWTLLGQISIVGANQGSIILVNLFHSVAANAAMSVGGQVNQAVTNLASNFQTAFNPQITKSYAEHDFRYLKKLVFSTSKVSYYLLFLVSIPIAFNINPILSFWLETVPEGSSVFCILMLGSGILNALSAPFNFCVMASGNIKWYQIATMLVYLMDLVILYCLFILGFPPPTAAAVKLCIMFFIVIVRVYFAGKEIPSINGWVYVKEAIVPILLSSSLCLCIYGLVFQRSFNLLSRCLITVVLFFVSCAIAYAVGLSRIERAKFKSMFNSLLEAL